MSKNFIDFVGIMSKDIITEERHSLQIIDTKQRNEDPYYDEKLYHAYYWHNKDNTFLTIQNGGCIKRRQEVNITPEQALKLLEFLQEQRERLQELCDNNKNKEI